MKINELKRKLDEIRDDYGNIETGIEVKRRVMSPDDFRYPRNIDHDVELISFPQDFAQLEVPKVQNNE